MLKLVPNHPIFNSGGTLAFRDRWPLGGHMDFALTPGGLLVHSYDEWPCAVCRPGQISESRAYCLCLNCAYAVVAAAGAGQQGARALLDEISEALCQLEAQQPEPHLPAN